MIDWQLFHFIRPYWLFALLPLALLLIALRQHNRRQSGWQSVLAGHLYQHLIATNSATGKRPPLYLLALGWLLGTLALAGPTWQTLPQPVYQLNTGKVVVMDMSLSMRATDVSPDRLSRARFKSIDLINAITEGETGLVAYAGDAFTISPLSTDAQNLTTLIPSLTPEIMPIPGSEPYLGLQAAIDLLSNAGYGKGEIFWITDGIEAAQVEEVRQLITSSPYRLSILAIGTEEGAPISLADGELLKDARGAIVIPRLNSERLRGLARSGGGRFVSMQADDSDIRYLMEQTLIDRDGSESADDDTQGGDQWREMGPYLLLLLLPIAAYSFRRGVLLSVGLLLILPGYAPQAHANWWDDLWQTPDQQGQQAYQQEAFGDAAQAFEDPLWKGAAHYKNGEYEAALDAFRQADGHQALYNQGNALAQLGEFDDAIAAYDRVLSENPDHEDAKANKALLEQLKQEQEQQQEQQGQNQQQDDSESQQQDQSSQDSEGQQGESQEDEQQQGEQSSEQSQQPQDSDNQQQGAEQSPEEAEQEAEQQQADQAEDDAEQEANADTQPQPAELTDEQKEEMQRMQNLLRRVPDDPAFLLKRKMQLESQRRQRDRTPTQRQRNW